VLENVILSLGGEIPGDDLGKYKHLQRVVIEDIKEPVKRPELNKRVSEGVEELDKQYKELEKIFEEHEKRINDEGLLTESFEEYNSDEDFLLRDSISEKNKRISINSEADMKDLFSKADLTLIAEESMEVENLRDISGLEDQIPRTEIDDNNRNLDEIFTPD
jgi:hypothetical protein